MIVKDEEKDREELVSELNELRQWHSKFSLLYNEYEDTIRRMRSFEKALETMQIGVTITDLDGNILYINSAELEMHGFTGQDLRGKNIKIFAPPDYWNPLTSEQIKMMKRWKRESINRRKDGSVFSVQLMSDIVADEDGVPLYIVTTCEDITGRKKMETEIRERVDELEKFYKMSVGREMKMKELKREIKRLKAGSDNSEDDQ
jgi:PAS domain S-box-containing protein